MTQPNLSPSILTRLQAPLTPDETLGMLGLPDGLTSHLSVMKLRALLRLSKEEIEREWPELAQQARPFLWGDSTPA